jgi:pyrroline-5-carboxylate reductase
MKIGFIGCGKMGEAMVSAMLDSKLVVPHEVFASDVSADQRRMLKKRYGINMYSRNNAIPGFADILFLAVKPQQLKDVLNEIAPMVTKKHLVVSIAAGKTIASIRRVLTHAKVIRVMPNLACTVAEGMSVLTAHSSATATDRQTAMRLLSCFGKVLELPEIRFDAVTAVSGSGPAFFAYFLEKIVQAGVAAGLDREHALLLAEQTMLGTSRLLIEKHVDPQALIDAVSSAKGTTAAGMEVLKRSSVAKVVTRTIQAAAQRSKELSA